MPKGTINGHPYELPEGYTFISEDAKRRGERAIQLLSDLDRSPQGRHKGDTESGAVGGCSHGNPLLSPGTHIGYGLDGLDHIVVPDVANLGDATAWYVTPGPEAP